MANWTKTFVGDMPIYQATTINWLPGAIQGFTTRRGGVSAKPFDTLNMSFAVEDSPAAVAENRQRVLTDLAGSCVKLVTASQLHGVGVACIDAPPEGTLEADALVTDTPGLLLTLLFADCVPVYILDPAHRAIGLAHSGWRGTAKNIVRHTLKEMRANFGTQPSACLAAIGPNISADHYEVGAEVADALRDAPGGKDSGSTIAVMPRSEFGNTWSVNLRQIVFTQLLQAGLKPEYVAVSDECTFRNKRDFFSHRRATQAGQKTGRMAAVFGLKDLDRGRRSG
ncbi:MAG TPA: peptidoglycan editing factor PgeF [Capsulimonadaceae bacterium]|nr:peptidoglycan editing factor PgeF [Capsulimonadaceae bacterium]